MKWLNLDFETFSEIDIKKVGAYKYSQHPSTELLLAGYSLNDGERQIWDMTETAKMPISLKRALENPKVLIYAFNANFERLILKYVLGIDLPLERFRCTMVHAYSLSFTGGLADVGEQIGIEKAKLTEGKELIKFFCSPKKPSKSKPWTRNLPQHDPEKWEAFKSYCIRDVEAEQEIGWFLEDYPMPEYEWNAWFMDQRINDRGLPLDMELISKAISIGEREKENVYGQLKKITNLDNPGSLPQLKTWLKEQNCHIPNLQGSTIEEWEKITKGNVRKVFKLILRVAKSSFSKYAKMYDTQLNGRVHGTLQFMGAQRTARWAGRLIQPQNFIRPEKGSDADKSREMILSDTVQSNVMAHMATALRGAICAPKGQAMSIADLAGIEGRVLPWLCFFEEKLDKIRAGLDMYLVAASGIYNVPYEKLENPSPERFAGKVAELALGYQGAINALNSMAASNGLEEFEHQTAQEIVKAWRKANEPIKQFWYDCEKAARNAMYYQDKVFHAGRLMFHVEHEFLCMTLPSGRIVYYHAPELNKGKLSYMGWNSFKRKWERINTYGGKLVENATQATARDILVHGMMKAEDKGFKLVGSVHDEILSCQKPWKKYNYESLVACMTSLPDWAQGLPLNAEGYTEKRYRK